MKTWLNRIAYKIPRLNFIVSLLIIISICLSLHIRPDSEGRNKNFRRWYNCCSGQNLVLKLKGAPPGWYLDQGDDRGATLLTAACIALTVSDDKLSERIRTPPKIYNALLLMLHGTMLFILYLAVYSLLGIGSAFGITMVCVFSGSLRFVLFGYDVYLFPFYAAVFLLAAFVLLPIRKPCSLILLGGCILGIGVCEFFRSGSCYVAFGFLIYALLYSWLGNGGSQRFTRMLAVGCFMITILLSMAPALFLGQRKHVVWHSLHAGLLEFGGFRDGCGRTYPSTIAINKLPGTAEKLTCWLDSYEIDYARKIDSSVHLFTPGYENILKNEVKRIALAYPRETLMLLMKRLWRFTLLNPWQPHDGSSLTLPSRADPLIRIFLIAVVAAGIIIGLDRKVALMVFGLLPSALPPLLVHSGYIMYNLPGQLPLYILVICSLNAIIMRTVKSFVEGLASIKA